jgi:hypothetical protein
MEDEDGMEDGVSIFFLHMSIKVIATLNSAPAFWAPCTSKVNLVLEAIVWILGQFNKITFASFDSC